MNQYLEEDILRGASSETLNFLGYNDRIVVTGSTGLIGSLLVKILLKHNEVASKAMQIYACVRDMEKADAVFGDDRLKPELHVVKWDVLEKNTFIDSADYIIHAASATKSGFFVKYPVETIQTAIYGTENLLNLARAASCKKVVYLSSLEVYGIPNSSKETIAEDEYGYLDPLQVRSCYSEGKRMAECLCVSYASEYQVPVVIARLSQTFGPGVDYNDSRVFAEFARCAVEGRDITLHTEGKTKRSYCYALDAALAVFLLLSKGDPGQAYNVTNEDAFITIHEMAERISSYSTKKIAVVKDISTDAAGLGYNPEMIIRLDSRKIRALGWHPTTGTEEMFTRLVESMRAVKREEMIE